MKKNLDRIWQYLDGEMGPDEENTFEKEMALDEDLRSEVEAQREIQESLSKSEVIDLRLKLRIIGRDQAAKNRKDKGRILPLYFMLAAASVVALFAFGYMTSQMAREGQQVKPVTISEIPDPPVEVPVVKADSLEKQAKLKREPAYPPKDTASASRDLFAENEMLESLIGIVYRSEFFQVGQPRTGQEFGYGEPVFFAWQPVYADSLELRIYNNDGFQLKKLMLAGDSFGYRDTLCSGLYYFKLISPNEDLFVGKFIVK